MSVGEMKDQNLQMRTLHASHTLGGCTPRSTTSTFWKYNCSYIHHQKLRRFMGKEKNICTTIRKFCTSIRIFQKSCCFFQKSCCFFFWCWYSVHHFTTFLRKKRLPAVFEHLTRQWGMISARRSTTRAWGCMEHDCLCTRVGLHLLPTHSYVNSWPSCLFQCRTYLVPVKLRSTWWWDEAKSAFVGPFSWLSCARTQVHMFACLLFASVCMRHTPTRSRATRAIRISLRSRFHEQHNCPFLVEKYVTIEVALVFFSQKEILLLSHIVQKFSESGTVGCVPGTW